MRDFQLVEVTMKGTLPCFLSHVDARRYPAPIYLLLYD